MKALYLILELLTRLLDYLKQKRIQKLAEQAEDDPADAFAKHFNGRVRDESNQASDKPDKDE